MIETFNKFKFKTALVLCWRTFEQEISKTMAPCHYVKSQVPTLHVKKSEIQTSCNCGNTFPPENKSTTMPDIISSTT